PGEAFVSDQLFGVNPTAWLLECNVPLPRNLSERVIDRHGLEISAEVLFALESLKQGLEVSGTEALRALPLNYLVEERRPVFHRLREYLEQVSLLVAIDENAKITDGSQILVDLADSLGDGVVVSPGYSEELDSSVSQFRDRLDDVVGRNRDVLASWSLIEFEIFVDLRFLLALRRLVERELDAAVPVGDHLRHQRRVLRGDRLVVE